MMMEHIGKWIVFGFGAFLIAAGFLMLLAPARANNILRKAGSTPLINYGEISLRLIPGAGLVLAAEASRFPFAFTLVGWFIIATCGILYFVPMRWHHAYAVQAADILKPLYFQLISPLSMALGGVVIYGVV